MLSSLKLMCGVAMRGGGGDWRRYGEWRTGNNKLKIRRRADCGQAIDPIDKNYILFAHGMNTDKNDWKTFSEHAKKIGICRFTHNCCRMWFNRRTGASIGRIY